MSGLVIYLYICFGVVTLRATEYVARYRDGEDVGFGLQLLYLFLWPIILGNIIGDIWLAVLDQGGE